MCNRSINKVVNIFILHILCSGFRENAAYCTCRTYTTLRYILPRWALNHVVTSAVLLLPVTKCKQLPCLRWACQSHIGQLNVCLYLLIFLRAFPKMLDITKRDNLRHPSAKEMNFIMKTDVEIFRYEVRCGQFQYKHLICSSKSQELQTTKMN
jgi:hypothetical protein